MEIKRSDLYKTKGYINVSLDNEKIDIPNELGEIIAELLAKKYMGGDDENAQLRGNQNSKKEIGAKASKIAV